MKTPIPQRLAYAREASGLSQRQIGIQAGIDPFAASPRINQYERGKHTPDYSTLCRIAKVLDVPVPYFYTADDQLAELLLQFHRLKPKARSALMTHIKNLIIG